MGVLDKYPWVGDRFRAVRPAGDRADAACPLGPHTTARVRFWVGDDGGLVFCCYAGCNKLEILRAVGATWADCFPGGAMPERVRQEVTARYRYRDEGGVLLYETVRLEPGRGGRDKDFRQRRPKSGGGWDWSLGDVRRVLYRLPELLAHDPAKVVLVTGGEKDADTAAGLGVVATTNVGGESAPWLDAYSDALRGRAVVVVQDRDATGARHANEVVGSLVARAAGSVRRVALPAKDLTAFVNGLRAAGVGKPADLRRELWEAIRAAPRWAPDVLADAGAA